MKSNFIFTSAIVLLFIISSNFSWGQVVSGGDFMIGTGMLTLHPKQAEKYQIGSNGWSGVSMSGGVIFYKRFVTNAGFSFGGNLSDRTGRGDGVYIGAFGQSFFEVGVLQSIIPFEKPDAETHLLLIGLTMGYNSGISLHRKYDMGRGMVDEYDDIGDIPGDYFLSPSLIINVGEKGLYICFSYRRFINQTNMQNMYLFQMGGLGINWFGS